MEQVPESIFGYAPRLIIRTEVGTEQFELRMRKKGKGCDFGIIVQSLANKRFVQYNRILISCSSFLFHRQSHIAIQYTHPTRGRSIMHFILCSSELFLNSSSEDPHFLATQCFVNVSHSSISEVNSLFSIPSTLEPRALTLIGIIGPSVGYAQTGKLLKSAFRLIAVGTANGQQGYSKLHECFSEYANRWKPFKKEKDDEKDGLKVRRRSPINQHGSMEAFPQNWGSRPLKRFPGQASEQDALLSVAKFPNTASRRCREGALCLTTFAHD